MTSLIDWDKLKPYKSDQKKSFEELCYQITYEEFGRLGTLTSIDDSGGGDGVEFYLKLENGDLWGWQCKFFDRFSEGNRKGQIKKSLQKAYKKHGSKLKKWFLCSKSALTVDERSWFENDLSKSAHDSQPVLPVNHEVTLVHWGDSEILNYLRSYLDIQRYFFSEKLLTWDWFKQKADIVLATKTLQSKYIHALHIEGDADEAVHKALGGEKLSLIIKEKMEALKVSTFSSNFGESLLELKSKKVKAEHVPIKEEIAGHALSDINLINDGVSLLKLSAELLAGADQAALHELEVNVKIYLERFRSYYIKYSNFKDSELINTISWESEENEIDDERKKAIKECRNALMGPYFLLRNYYDPYVDIFDGLLHLHQRELHITGNASKGKTHLASSIFENRIDNYKPAIFLFGKDFKSSNPLTEQIRQLLDLPSDWSVSDFLGALNIAARVHNTKAVLLIDGLNESIYWKDIWGDSLEKLIININKNYNHILLITTYRSSYEDQLFPNDYFLGSDENYKKRIEVDGFNNNVSEAIQRYFSYYSIKLKSGSRALDHFKEPLYLKIFCETKQGQVVSFQKEDLFDVFDQYLQKCNTNVITSLQLSPRYNQNFLQKKLLSVAAELWNANSREIYLEDLLANFLTHDELFGIEAEDLLIFRDWNEQEVVSYTYDLLGGYLIAKHLVERFKSKANLVEFINSIEFHSKLLDRGSKHPLFNDILRCLSILAIKKFGLFLFDITSNETLHKYSIESLFEVNARYILENEILVKAYISKYFESGKRTKVFELSEITEFDTEHPINFSFISELLKNQSVAQRDLSWTEYVRRSYHRYSRSSLNNFLPNLVTALKEKEVLSSRIHLAALKAMWLLTSTNIEIRDLATRVLYIYGRRFPLEYTVLTCKSLSLNDPYIWERTLASLYGITMAEHNSLTTNNFKENILPVVGRRLFELLFNDNAPHSTTHILARDYARRTIDIALLHHPALLTQKEKERLTPPYSDGGIRNWGEFDYGTKEWGYDRPIRMDFSNYTIGGIVQDGHSYSNPSEKQKVRRQIYWRIYDLGWDEKLFSEAEKSVGNDNYQGHRTERAKVERYGKKYSWIAFYEVAGYRDDLNLLDREWNHFRNLNADIDPSFPIKPKNEKFFTKDLLGDRESPLLEWYLNGGNPEIDEYLLLKNFNDEQEDWVCIDAYVSQDDTSAGRERFTFVRAMLVKVGDYAEVLELLKKQDLGGRWLPEKRENYSAFAGELYYCPESTYENYIDLEFVIERKKVIVRKGEPGYYPLTSFDFTEEGMIFNEDYPDEIEREVEISKEYQVLLPVMEYHFEGNKSELDAATSETVVAKEIANDLGLIDQPQTFDLYDQNGKKASLTLRFYQDFNNSHHFVYLRKDLFDKYLDINGYKLVWAVWGERQVSYKNDAKREEFFKENSLEGFQVFQKIVEY